MANVQEEGGELSNYTFSKLERLTESFYETMITMGEPHKNMLISQTTG